MHWLLVTLGCSLVATNVALFSLGLLRSAQRHGRFRTDPRADVALFGPGAILALGCYALGLHTLATCLFMAHQVAVAVCFQVRGERRRAAASAVADVADVAGAPTWSPKAPTTQEHHAGDATRAGERLN